VTISGSSVKLWYNDPVSGKKKLVTAMIIAALILAVVAWWCAPGFVRVVTTIARLLVSRDDAGFTAYVRSFGWPGVIVLFAVQAFQVFFPIFPEVILQIAAGATYGVLGGTLVLMTSYTICNFIIFLLLRHYCPRLPDFILASSPWKKCRRILDQHSPQTVVFILYLFPFLSNCFVPYMAVQTGIRFRSYAWIMIVSCLPMMMTSVYLGDRLLAHDWLMAAVAFLAGSLVSLVLYFGQKQILGWLRLKFVKRENPG